LYAATTHIGIGDALDIGGLIADIPICSDSAICNGRINGQGYGDFVLLRCLRGGDWRGYQGRAEYN